MMVRPASFSFNYETAANNHFQQEPLHPGPALQQTALRQFDGMVKALKAFGVEVIVIEDNLHPPKPDAIFPNNWFCANNNTVSVFPLFAPSRRPEKRNDILQHISRQFIVNGTRDWSHFEESQKYLEGTGSMVIDHVNHIVYACLSPRTDKAVLDHFASEHGYSVIAFTATDASSRPIYHTNVMLCIGEAFAVICDEAIQHEDERTAVIAKLEQTGHECISISPAQMNAFAGNMLQLQNKNGERCIVMSKTAHRSLHSQQVLKLEKHGALLVVDVSIIEEVEGGSTRCMMAEIFLQPR